MFYWLKLNVLVELGGVFYSECYENVYRFSGGGPIISSKKIKAYKEYDYMIYRNSIMKLVDIILFPYSIFNKYIYIEFFSFFKINEKYKS